MYSFIYLYIYLSIFYLITHSHLCTYSFICQFICLFLPLPVVCLVLFVCSFVCLCVCSFRNSTRQSRSRRVVRPRARVLLRGLRQRTARCPRGWRMWGPVRHRLTTVNRTALRSPQIIQRRSLRITESSTTGILISLCFAWAWCEIDRVVTANTTTMWIPPSYLRSVCLQLDHNASRACNHNALRHLTSIWHVPSSLGQESLLFVTL